MRRTTLLFLCAETLDLLTTIIGLKMGMTEMNPLVYKFGWDAVIIFKIFATIIIAIVLQKKKYRKHDIIIPWLAFIPVIWNTMLIVTY
jgi:hypothetical protein